MALQGISAFPVAPIHLLHALAKVTTPAVPNLAAFSASWAERRYIWAFNPSRKGARPRLRLSVYSRRLDFHQKTLLSDDLGVAVACYVMETFFPVAEIANATTAVESRTQGVYRIGKKWPDLVCTDASGNGAYVVECKGSGSGWTEVRRQLKQGTRQVTAVGFGAGVQTERFVLATQFRKNGFLVHAIDPPAGDDDSSETHNELRAGQVGLEIPEVRLLSTARTLAFCGDYGAAIRRLPSSILESYPKVEPPEFAPEALVTSGIEAVGRTDRWETPAGHMIEVFRGLDRGVHEALVRGDRHPRKGDETAQAEYRIGYKLGLEQGDREDSITSLGRDGTVLRIRMYGR